MPERATAAIARRVAANSRCWWRNSGMLLNAVLNRLTSTPWDCLDSPDLKRANRPVRTRTPGGVTGARLS